MKLEKSEQGLTLLILIVAIFSVMLFAYHLIFNKAKGEYLDMKDYAAWVDSCEIKNNAQQVVAIQYVIDGKEVAVIVDETHPNYNRNHPFIRHTITNDSGEVEVTYEFREPKLTKNSSKKLYRKNQIPCTTEYYIMVELDSIK